MTAPSRMQQSAEAAGGRSQLVHLSSEVGGAVGARSVMRATAPGACWPARVKRSVSAFGADGAAPEFMPKRNSELTGSRTWNAEAPRVPRLTVIERGLAWRSRQEVGPPDRKLWVRRAR